MTSSCTAQHRLFRCRVRDLASCFFACRLPLEEDQPDKPCSKTPKMSGGSIVIDFDGAANGSRKMSTVAKIKGESISYNSSSSSTSLREPRFSEEEYIVFCFGEDGEIDMVNGERSAEDNDKPHGTTTAVTLPKDTQISKQDEEGKRKRDTQNSEDENKGREVKKNESVDADMNTSKISDNWESSDSNRSDTTSASSFAFPILGIEWTGSPVYMPKSEKQSVNLHCCRF